MSAKSALQSIRSRMRVDKQEAQRSGAAYVGAGVLGALEGYGTLDKMPTIPGVPPLVMIAVASKVAGNYTSGTTSGVANGIGDAAAIVAISQFTASMGRAARAAAPAAPAAHGIHGRASQLESRLRDRLSDDELDDLEEALSGVRD